MNQAEDGGQAPAPEPGEEPDSKRPGLLKRLKGYAKDTVVASTSTHGGVAGGIHSRKSRRKKN